MKLYHNGQAWQVPGQQDKKAERFDVPTDSHGLCAFLNERNVPASTAPVEFEPEDGDYHPLDVEPGNTASVAADLARREQAIAATFEAQQIEEFILERATVAQVEQIYARLGTRFAELVKGGRS